MTPDEAMRDLLALYEAVKTSNKTAEEHENLKQAAIRLDSYLKNAKIKPEEGE